MFASVISMLTGDVHPTGVEDVAMMQQQTKVYGRNMSLNLMKPTQHRGIQDMDQMRVSSKVARAENLGQARQSKAESNSGGGGTHGN